MKGLNKTEAILNSLDGIKRAAPKPFMYTRIMAKMQKEETNFWSKTGSFIARPVVAICSLVLIIATNIYFVTHSDPSEYDDSQAIVITDGESDFFQNGNAILASNSNYDLNK